MRRKQRQTQQEYYHPSTDRSTRFELDFVIRRYGFKIHSRLGNLPALWADKFGNILTQKEVLKLLNRDDILNAEYLEELYWYGMD